ncbi:hypothetical protein NLX83_20655 [Allokutzneria sp. A3M-2-11 16]|uniref:DUF6923 family protein n=1 Tax=Allokutzneria sp. A3M-2-11 16 TaxID=2962043 RepID=UPI0020B85389|nr:hypothetical protein [Allokutzneria sp. A3M-2-11 16]MCP3801677.1 hypothetical protein [Allokutzneria sp. A3M-2-11 16]
MCGTALVLVAVVPLPDGEAAPPVCTAYQVRTTGHGSLSTLLRVQSPSWNPVSQRQLDFAVNAIGFARSQGLTYGIASRDRSGPFRHIAHVVTIDNQGRVTDLGPVRKTGPVRLPHSGFLDAYAGAASGNRLYLRDDSTLYALDINPSSPTFLGVLSAVRMRPSWPVEGVDDFAVNEADGQLYGVSSSGPLHGILVRINPSTGAVTKLPTHPELPGWSSYGAVVIDSARNMYALNNNSHGASRVFHISLDGSGATREVAQGPRVVAADGAGCLAAPPSPPPPPPPPKPTPTTPRPTPTTTTTAPPTTTPPVTTEPPPTTAPPPAPPPKPKSKPLPVSDLKKKEVAQTSLTPARKWTMATVIMVMMGAGTAAAAYRNRR